MPAPDDMRYRESLPPRRQDRDRDEPERDNSSPIKRMANDTYDGGYVGTHTRGSNEQCLGLVSRGKLVKPPPETHNP